MSGGYVRSAPTLVPSLSFRATGAAIATPIWADDGVRPIERVPVNAGGSLSLRATLAPLGARIGKVVRLCSEKEVVGSHALGIVATMEHGHSIGDRTVTEFPRVAMGADGDEVIAHAKPKAAVAEGAPWRPEPRPATIGALNPPPETDLVW